MKSSKLTNKDYQYSIISGSMNGCAMATLDKCNGFSDGDTPENMIEVRILLHNLLTRFKSIIQEPLLLIDKQCLQKIGGINSIEHCQSFCKFIYSETCTWFLYDNKNKECKLFNGQLDDLFDRCNDNSFAEFPSFLKCMSVFNPTSDNGCYVRII